MNLSLEPMIGIAVLGLFIIIAIVFIILFVKGIFENKKYDVLILPDLEEKEEELPDVELDESTFQFNSSDDVFLEEPLVKDREEENWNK